MTRALASPLNNAVLNTASGASMAPPYDQLSLAEVGRSSESVEGPPANPQNRDKG